MYLIYFAFGYIIGIYKDQIKFTFKNQFLEMAIFCFTSIVLFLQCSDNPIIKGDNYLIALIGIICIFSLCDLLGKLMQSDAISIIVHRISRDSFFVYLLHDPINFIALSIGEKLVGIPFGTIFYFGIRSWINIIFCLFMAELFYRYIEKQKVGI